MTLGEWIKKNQHDDRIRAMTLGEWIKKTQYYDPKSGRWYIDCIDLENGCALHGFKAKEISARGWEQDPQSDRIFYDRGF